jgi:DNA-binding transcriptional LysR family regulator
VAIEAADAALAVGGAGEARGTLRLGLPLAGGRDRLYALAQAYVERYPAVEVESREAISEHLQRQVLAGDLDAALGVAPSRLPALTYEHLHDEPVWVWMARGHPLAERDEIGLADLGGQALTLLGGPLRQAGYNRAVRSLFAGTGVEPLFVETLEMNPARAGHSPGYLGLSIRMDFAADVVARPLVPARTFPLELVHRADASQSAIRAFVPVARSWLAGEDRGAMPAGHDRRAIGI